MNIIAQRSLWNRMLPVAVRQNARLIFGSLLLIVATGFILGTFQIRPVVFASDSVLDVNEITFNVRGNQDFFDLSVPHRIDLAINDIEYQKMIRDFQVLGEKSWILVDATIDGVYIPSVGVRLKGNSTLFALGGDGPMGMRARFGGRGRGMQGMEGMPDMERMEEMAGSLVGGASFEEPSSLPLLISFNEFYPGRAFQGYPELALRPANVGSSSMNEALSLQLIADTGQVSQDYSWVEFSINGGSTATRLVLENPNQQYAYRINQGRGVLYKSTSENKFEYKGEDSTGYIDDFDQLNGIGNMDLAPVIAFLRWMDAASDEVFDAELAERLDIPSFAKYVVTQDLLGNFDDMAGPGRNFLFWYSLETSKFTVITWDMNLALIGDNPMAMMMRRPPPGMSPPEGAAGFTPPSGMTPPPGMENMDQSEIMEMMANNAQAEPPAGMPFPMMGGDQVGMLDFFENMPDIPGMPTIGNQLKDRFVASEAISSDIDAARAELSALWTVENVSNLIDELSLAVPASDILTSEHIALDIQKLKQNISSMLR